MSLIKLLLVSLLAFTSLQTTANSLYISLIDFPNLFNTDKSGAYDPLFKHLTNKGLIEEAGAVPFNRAIEYFRSGKMDCIAPTSIKSVKTWKGNQSIDLEKIVFSDAFNNYAMRLISLPTTKQPKSINDLSGIPIGHVTGNDMEGIFEQIEFRPIIFNTYKDMFRGLAYGRMKIAVVVLPDLQFETNFKEGNDYRFVSLGLSHEGEEQIACHKTPKNLEIIKHLNHEINTLKSSGVLQQLLGRAYVSKVTDGNDD